MSEDNKLKECQELLLDCIWQACGDMGDNTIDNKCMSAYEAATEYLFQKGLINKINDRMYRMR